MTAIFINPQLVVQKNDKFTTGIIYKKGIEVDRKVGGVPESNMKEFLEKNI